MSLIGGIVCEGGEGRKKEEGGRERAELGGDGRRISLRQLGQRTVTGIISEGAWLSSLHSSRPDRSSRVAATPEPQTPGQQGHHALPVPEFTPIQVKIFYSLKNPADGIQFVQPSELYQTVSVPYTV